MKVRAHCFIFNDNSDVVQSQVNWKLRREINTPIKRAFQGEALRAPTSIYLFENTIYDM